MPGWSPGASPRRGRGSRRRRTREDHRIARICVLRQHYVPLDPRVAREVRALAEAGHDVEVICLRRPGEPGRARAGRLRVWRLPMRHRRAGPLAYVLEHAAFVLLAGALATALALRRRLDLVQANTLPDSIVLAAAGPRLLGARVLLDLHECVPEFVATTFGVAAEHPAVRLAAAVEQAAIRHVDAALTCTEPMRRAFVSRGADPGRLTVVHNGSQEDVFDPARPLPRPARRSGFTLVCHGTVEERYGIDTVVRALPLLEGVELRVIGDGSQLPDLEALARELGVRDRVHLSGGFVELDDLVAELAHADAGVVATRRDAFRDLVHTNKMFDLIAMRRPVVMARTPAVEQAFPEECFAYFTSGDPTDLARAVRRVRDDPEGARSMVERAARAAEPLRWPEQRRRYLGVVAGLVAGRDRSGREAAPPDS